MSSVAARTRQNAPSHFMTISSINGQIYSFTPAGSGTGGSLSSASWAWSPQNGNKAYLSTLASPGALLRDIGKNVVSSNRYFRKIQFVARTGSVASGGVLASTFGVAGEVGTTPNVDYLTGYIELGYEGGGTPAPVVQFGTL